MYMCVQSCLCCGTNFKGRTREALCFLSHLEVTCLTDRGPHFISHTVHPGSRNRPPGLSPGYRTCTTTFSSSYVPRGGFFLGFRTPPLLLSRRFRVFLLARSHFFIQWRIAAKLHHPDHTSLWKRTFCRGSLGEEETYYLHLIIMQKSPIPFQPAGGFVIKHVPLFK